MADSRAVRAAAISVNAGVGSGKAGFSAIRASMNLAFATIWLAFRPVRFFAIVLIVFSRFTGLHKGP
jgi:hypothetical protein